MKHLWSPWRMKYIEQNEQDAGCVFCSVVNSPDSAENLIIHRAKYSYVILNRFPYTTGHLMIVPFDHQAKLEGLDPVIRAEMMELTNQSIKVLEHTYQPEGFNLGANLGTVAGAGIAEHIHLHIVPRWGGDTNFMSTLGETRVIPEALEDTYDRILSGWTTLFSGEINDKS